MLQVWYKGSSYAKRTYRLYSKPLDPKQQVLFEYEREMLTIFHVVTKWRHCLWGRHFKIKTNHVILMYLLDQMVTFPSQYLWLAELMGYDYEIEYKKERENIAVGTLSRITCIKLCTLGLSTISTNLIEEIKAS